MDNSAEDQIMGLQPSLVDNKSSHKSIPANDMHNKIITVMLHI